MTWLLGKYSVSPGRATMSQIVRYTAGFLAYLTLLLVSVVLITLDTGVDRFIILVSSVLATTIVFFIIFVYIISSSARLKSFAKWSTHVVNGLVRRITFGQKHTPCSWHPYSTFSAEFHDDCRALRADKGLLLKPYLWGLYTTLWISGCL